MPIQDCPRQEPGLAIGVIATPRRARRRWQDIPSRNCRALSRPPQRPQWRAESRNAATSAARPAQARNSATNPERAARIFASPISASRMRGSLPACARCRSVRIRSSSNGRDTRVVSCTNAPPIRSSACSDALAKRFVPVKTCLRVIDRLGSSLPRCSRVCSICAAALRKPPAASMS